MPELTPQELAAALDLSRIHMLTEQLAQAKTMLAQREDDFRAIQVQLAHSLHGAKEQYAELQQLRAGDAAWGSRKMDQLSRKEEHRDAEIRRLQGILTKCEELLAVAKATLQSRFSRDERLRLGSGRSPAKEVHNGGWPDMHSGS